MLQNLRPAITTVEKILHAAIINKQLNLLNLKKIINVNAYLFEDEDIYTLNFTNNKISIKSLDAPEFETMHAWLLEGTRLTLLRSKYGRCVCRTIHIGELVYAG